MLKPMLNLLLGVVCTGLFPESTHCLGQHCSSSKDYRLVENAGACISLQQI